MLIYVVDGFFFNVLQLEFCCYDEVFDEML